MTYRLRIWRFVGVYAALFLGLALGATWLVPDANWGFLIFPILLVPAMLAAGVEGGGFAKRARRLPETGEGWRMGLAMAVSTLLVLVPVLLFGLLSNEDESVVSVVVTTLISMLTFVGLQWIVIWLAFYCAAQVRMRWVTRDIERAFD